MGLKYLKRDIDFLNILVSLLLPFYAGAFFFYAGGPSVCHIPLFLCCEMFFFMLCGASSYAVML